MTAEDSSVVLESRTQYWLRVLRPLCLWLLFVLFLFGIRTHERLMEQTRITFSPRILDFGILYDAEATLGNQHIQSGNMIPLGWHTFTIKHSKGETFTTNLFVWYGPHDFGDIYLKRTTGVLELHAAPEAVSITIVGPEFKQALTNSSGIAISMPTGVYSVETRYAHWLQKDEVEIFYNRTNFWRVAPRLGVLSMTCNREGASFELMNSKNRLIEAGGFPANIQELPEGEYKLLTQHHNNRFEQTVSIKGSATNSLEVDLLYGVAYLVTEPSGATVLSDNGHDWGVTPVTIPELPVGNQHFTLRKDGYELASVSLDIASDQNCSFHTNLVGRNYGAALKAAQQYFANGEFERASKAADEALLAKRDDPAALKLQRESMGYSSLRQAEAMGKRGDYIAGLTELERTINYLPDNAEVNQILTDFKQKEPGQRKQMRLERLNRGREVFKRCLVRQNGEQYFEPHELKTPMPVNKARAAIIMALANQPAFKITRDTSTAPETFELEATQEFSTFLNTIAGRRTCAIVGAQTTDTETQVIFKVLEYKTEAVEKFSIGNLIGTPVNVYYAPIRIRDTGKLSDKLQAQLTEGVSNVTARIQRAIASEEN
ncbi:MAG TPA: PEGA domain-containing protein [Verrucomicrobiae bacterium]|jgi:tetratricopeptide (TPR) repeat protein|nr:PEGA domain-containing protein [Verrucomicrobiae bacterium]